MSKATRKTILEAYSVPFHYMEIMIDIDPVTKRPDILIDFLKSAFDFMETSAKLVHHPYKEISELRGLISHIFLEVSHC